MKTILPTFVVRFDFPDDDCARVGVRVFLVEMDLGERGTVEVGHTVATKLAAKLKQKTDPCLTFEEH